MSHSFKDDFLVLVPMEPPDNTVVHFEMVLSFDVRRADRVENRVLSLSLLEANPGCDSDGGSWFSLEGISFEVDSGFPEASSLATCVVIVRELEDLTSRRHLAGVFVSGFVGDDLGFANFLEIVVNNQTF